MEPSAAPSPTPTPAGDHEPPASGKGEVQVVQLTKLQQTVAQRMALSKATAPHFQLQADVDMSRCIEARAQLKALTADGDAAPSLNDFVVKACATALREHPRANGAYRDGAWELSRA